MSLNLGQAARDAAERVTSTPSAIVEQQMGAIKSAIQPMAAKNHTGAAATILRRIESRVGKVLIQIRALETQLNAANDNQSRSQIAEKLRATIDKLFLDVAMDWLDLRLQLTAQPGVAERLQQRLPAWFNKLIEKAKQRGGLPVAGGAVRPYNLKNTTGNRPEPNFRGEVVPHHALPERQREGLRPDGLEWLYAF